MVALCVIRFRFFLTGIIGMVLLFAAGTSLAAGIAFLPDAEREHIFPERPNLSILTFKVPGGLLVADRVAPGDENRYGVSFEPRFKESEFFLLQGKGRSLDALEILPDLDAFGHVHWQRDAVFLVEIPKEGRDEFMARDFNRTRIRVDSPADGWDRMAEQATGSLILGGNKDLALVEDFVANVSGPAFFQTIQEISGHAYFFHDGLKSVSTRFYNTADKDLVGDYLADKLIGYGYSVEFDAFTSGSVPCRNIVATKTGTRYPDEYVIVGGHYDSISGNPGILAPGAEDNGSGTAAVVEIARISAGRQFERTVQFVLFDSEEQGLYGSQHFVSEAVSAGREIIAAITMDMVAYYDTHYAVRIEGETPWEWLMSIMESNTGLFTDIGNQKDYNSWGSDHVPFQQAGIPAFLAIDYDYGSYPGYHQTNDNWNQIAFSAQIGTQITIASAATMAEVAGLQPDLSPVDDLPAFGPIEILAYPNPFNPRVTIAFNSDRDLVGEVAVFDLSGRRVAVLARGPFAKGLNRVTWDGRNVSGGASSSGKYVCRLQAGEHVATVKINLVR
ncbi:MAG: hypothetical protein DRP71_12690 [Verrucomicrobia bacterium]|nr:MAG: hypothetical protein DRP71_12690 [Verrucomicrobiota bacterium]